MVTSFAGSFREADQLEAAFTAGRGQVTITQPGRYATNIIGVDFGRLLLIHGEHNLANVSHLELVPDRVTFSFLPGVCGGVFNDGQEVRQNQISQHCLGRSWYQTMLGPTPWGGILLPPEEIEGMAAIFGSARRSPQQSHDIIPSAQAVQRLMRLYTMAVQLVRDAPEMLQRPEAMRGLEHAVIEALAGCLIGEELPGETVGQRNHATVMRQFHRLLADNPADTLFLADVCDAIGVSARTLRGCCEAHIGMGPKHFLTLRRMHLARCRLRDGGGKASVTDVATEFGFWELGRFAVAYRALFGESPSVTTGRRPQCARPQTGGPDSDASSDPVHAWFGPQWLAAISWLPAIHFDSHWRGAATGPELTSA
jgi:AraC-like DNA-binding protein